MLKKILAYKTTKINCFNIESVLNKINLKIKKNIFNLNLKNIKKQKKKILILEWLEKTLYLKKLIQNYHMLMGK